jgi:hypothetical protein
MKKIYLLASVITGLFASTAIAQSITATGCNPVIGETFNYKTTTSFGPGGSGSGQTWNFATISGTSSTSSVVAVGSTTSGSSFPSATIALSGAASSYSYQKTSSSALQHYGSVAGGVVISYSNPEDLLHYPFALSNTYSDNFAATFTNSGFTFYRAGSVTITADGSGTLITPTGTFTSVLRVHMVENYSDSANIFGTPTVTAYSNDQYLWYKDGTHFPLASTYTFTTGAGTTSAGSYYVSTTVGIDELNALSNSLTVFPNPASQNVRLNFTLADNQKMNVAIANRLGQIVVNQNMEKSAGEQTLDLDVAGFDKGIYFVRITTEDGLTATRKIIVQ